jgi:hypothetical protein
LTSVTGSRAGGIEVAIGADLGIEGATLALPGAMRPVLRCTESGEADVLAGDPDVPAGDPDAPAGDPDARANVIARATTLPRPSAAEFGFDGVTAEFSGVTAERESRAGAGFCVARAALRTIVGGAEAAPVLSFC